MLFSPAILTLLRRDGSLAVETDTFGKQTGEILLQEQAQRRTKPAVYFYCRITKAELNYDTEDHERLAVVCACLMLRPYLDMQHLIVVTGREVITWH